MEGSETIPFGSTPIFISAEALRTFSCYKNGDDIVHAHSNVRINVSDGSLVRIQPGEHFFEAYLSALNTLGFCYTYPY